MTTIAEDVWQILERLAVSQAELTASQQETHNLLQEQIKENDLRFKRTPQKR
jgi:hypothetical protein